MKTDEQINNSWKGIFTFRKGDTTEQDIAKNFDEVRSNIINNLKNQFNMKIQNQYYRLKPDFKHCDKLVSTLALTEKLESRLNSTFTRSGDNFLFTGNAIKNLRDAGVFDLWFERSEPKTILEKDIEDIIKKRIDELCYPSNCVKYIVGLDAPLYEPSPELKDAYEKAIKRYSKTDILNACENNPLTSSHLLIPKSKLGL